MVDADVLFIIFNNHYSYTLMLEQTILTCFFVFAVWSTMLPGMIFGKVREVGDDVLADWVRYPLYECPICSTPYYGSAFYWFAFGNSIKEWVVVILCAMGLAAIIIKFLKSTPEE